VNYLYVCKKNVPPISGTLPELYCTLVSTFVSGPQDTLVAALVKSVLMPMVVFFSVVFSGWFLPLASVLIKIAIMTISDEKTWIEKMSFCFMTVCFLVYFLMAWEKLLLIMPSDASE